MSLYNSIITASSPVCTLEQLLQRASRAATGSATMSNPIVIGLAGLVLLVIFFLLIRTFVTKPKIAGEQAPPPLPKDEEEAAGAPDDLDEHETAEDVLSLKEIKARRAAKVSEQLTSKDELRRAREARKGKSRGDQGELAEADAEARDDARGAEAPGTADVPDETSRHGGQDVEATPEAGATAKETPSPGEVSKAKPEGQRDTAPKTERKSLQDGLEKTRTGFVGRLRGIFGKKTVLDDTLIEALEEVLFTADIGSQTSQHLLEAVESRLEAGDEGGSEGVWELLRAEITRILTASKEPLRIGAERPYVILVIGVNGVGKTTTIGKLANRFKSQGLSVMMIAGDTFRAAASDQLQVWGKRTGCEVFSGKEQADPSGVVFAGLQEAAEKGVDLVLVDTAGRLHTKVNLVEELKKVKRVCDKALPGTPHQCLLVLDANTGQNAISQAQMFNQEIGLTGLVLTKLDGTAKGGVVIGISDELKVPIQFIGIGEQMEDLRVFNPADFADALF